MAANITPPPVLGSGGEDGFEKTPLKSKKFMAYLLADLGWKLLLAGMLFMYGDSLSMLEWGLMMGVILVSGFVQVGMLLGQASLDKFIRIAQINSRLGVPTNLKGENGKVD